MKQDPDQLGKFVFLLYVAAGIPVAWLHMRQQKMMASHKQLKQVQGQGLVTYTLAVMWPLLLLVMALNWKQRKRQPSQAAEKGAPAPPASVRRE
ncbi:hypothetical protein [Lacipirellula sp.]|uniref:hypothetical protein n=1 Tax=Lacipirellula sp. TaxID=2691419 RepID=UPI003D0D3ED9